MPGKNDPVTVDIRQALILTLDRVERLERRMLEIEKELAKVKAMLKLLIALTVSTIAAIVAGW